LAHQACAFDSRAAFQKSLGWLEGMFSEFTFKDTGGFTELKVKFAVPDFVGSATLVAVTVTMGGEGTVAGAV